MTQQRKVRQFDIRQIEPSSMSNPTANPPARSSRAGRAMDGKAEVRGKGVFRKSGQNRLGQHYLDTLSFALQIVVGGQGPTLVS